MMKARWKKFGNMVQELQLTDWVEANVFDASMYLHRENPKDWGWNVSIGYDSIRKGRAKTESLAKQAAERELVKLFRQLGKALDYDVE